jgi:hypothetical protein
MLNIRVLAVVWSVVIIQTASAQSNQHACTTSATAGTYSVACSGWTTGSGGALVPVKQLGVATGDRSGFWTGATTINIAGQVVIPKATVSGQSVVNSDCTGTLTYNKGTSTEVNITFVVNPRTDEILGITTDQGSVISCELKRMSNNPGQPR